ncbi:MAG: type II/IV secretion system protein [Candidatus Eremiobacteraeota bacterium]|nr:type II/IV secretion system protein [Candidatus Eremiobacteraeota bacterium]
MLLDDTLPGISRDALDHIPYALAQRYGVLAYRAEGSDLHVLVPDASDDDTLDRIRNVSGMRVVPREASPKALRARIATAYGIDEIPAEEPGDAPPAIRALDEVHEAAVAANASDIHLEPTHHGGRVRHRVDGMLFETRMLPVELFAQVVSRVKLLAAMDIADRRQPQDGRYSLTVDRRSIDVRVSSMPTINGEKLVIRLLDLHARIPTLEELGMPPSLRAQYRSLVHSPYGFIVVCGPTGSGKTTTLYASLSERNVVGQHLCTVEDPVEVRVPGVAQVQVNERAGMTFAAALRSFLRQDPNVLMVGEMRDGETAKVALSAALSGQLVMTTLHASDAPRVIERLNELGADRHAIAAGLSAVLAQRLVRRLCRVCRERSELRADAHAVGLPAGTLIYKPGGCTECSGTGYRGRVGIFEYLPVTQDIRIAIASGASSVTVAELGRSAGYRPMLADGITRLSSGETSLEELHRVLTFETQR